MPFLKETWGGGKTQIVLTKIYFIKSQLSLAARNVYRNGFAHICLRIREAEEG